MPANLPIGGVTLISFTLTCLVIGNAYYQKKQLYPSVVYITKSNPSLAVIYLLAFTFVIIVGKLLKTLFFGTLRAAELEQLLERSFYAVTETCLAFTVFRDDFSPKFVSLFTFLLFLKAFHYLTDSRVDFMERSPVITMLFHIRVTSLLLLLSAIDMLLVRHSYISTMTQGASVQLVFGFEYAILLTVVFNIAVKYLCHFIDLRSETPWENKAVYLLYTEIVVGWTKVMLYVLFLCIMIKIHTFPLFIIRPMYITARAFKKALSDVIQSRRAIHYMNTLYPDALAEELATVDNVCIICRDEMSTGAKKLPCSHIFHSSCLRSWFQRQQTCPTCRLDILQQTPIPTVPQPDPNVQQRPEARPQQPPFVNPFLLFGQNLPAQVAPNFPFNLNRFPQPPIVNSTSNSASISQTTSSTLQNIRPANAFLPPQFPFTFPLNQMPIPAPTFNANQTPTSSNQSNASASNTSQQSPPFPNFFPFMPFTIPFPTLPPNFSGLTLHELQNMEGRERKAVEARIRTLSNIQTLLDAACVQLNQYYSVADLPQSNTSDNSKQTEKNSESTNPSTAADSKTINEVKSEPSTSEDEVRKRRLEKFLNKVSTTVGNSTDAN